MSEPRIHAPELDGGSLWLNTEQPLRLGDLRGKLVLLDFWTHCCINCQHVLEDLRPIAAEHRDSLVVIGVHSAKFTNEREDTSLARAVERLRIEHPVLSDPDRLVADAYAVRSWPTLILIDPEGYVVGAVAGEGHHELLDQVVREKIEEYRERGELDESPPAAPAVRARDTGALAFPGKVLADPEASRLFIADTGHHRIIVADRDGQVLQLIGDGVAGSDDGHLADARFRDPQGMALSGGRLYVADSGNHLIRVVDLAAGEVETIAGDGTQARELNQPGHGRDVALSSPWDLVAIDLPGATEGELDRFLFVAMAGSHQLWVVDLETGNAYPFAGSGGENIRDGLRVEACFAQPSGLAFDGARLFVADAEVSAVRALDLNSETVSTVIGQGLFVFGDRDGGWEEAMLQHPLGVAVDAAARTLWLADTFNHKVKRLDLEARTVTTVCGDGKPGRDDGSPGRLDEPGGLSLGDGRVYIADTNNHLVRVLEASGELDTLDLAGF